MLKSITYFLCLIFLLCQCGTPIETLTLRSNKATLSIDPSIGGRISSLTYGENEVLKTSRDSANLQWGSTVWTAPQSDWKWPPPSWIDSDSYDVKKVSAREIILQSQLSPGAKLQCTKSIQVVGIDSFLLSYSIENLGSEDQDLALWENSRIPHSGRVSWQTQKELWELGPAMKPVSSESSWLFLDKRKTPRKLFKKSEGGYLRYENEHLIWTKIFNILTSDEVAPGQATIEIYDDPVQKFGELEVQGRYQTVRPGEKVKLDVLWVLSDKNID